MRINIHKGLNKFLTYALVTSIGAGALTGCNRRLADTTYHYNKALIVSENSAILLPVSNWHDFKGEEIQLCTDDNFVMLTSSFDTNCFSGNSENYSAASFAEKLSTKFYDYTNGEKNGIFNKAILENLKYNKVIIFNGNNAVILPVDQFRRYQGEQLQVITPFGLFLVLSSYNAKLVYDEVSNLKADEFARAYLGENGKVVDYTVGIPPLEKLFNFDLIDTQMGFNKIIDLKETGSTVMTVKKWRDYEGEQLQFIFKNDLCYLSDSYDTLIVNDQDSLVKASDIASALSDSVKDISEEGQKIFFNKQLVDLNYGFSSCAFTVGDATTLIPAKEWNDYEGEQLQIVTENKDIILGTSMIMDLFNGGTEELCASSLAKNFAGKDGKLTDKLNGRIDKYLLNKTLTDIDKNGFNYALKICGDNIVIIPIKKWLDFENPEEKERYVDSDGETKTRSVKGEPNCEQVQFVLPDGSVLLDTAYNYLIVKNNTPIQEIAEDLCPVNGEVIDLTPVLGEPNGSFWNKSFVDTHYKFNQAIISKGNKAYLFNFKKWYDYADGEQLQLTFNDSTDLLTSYVNTCLVHEKTDGVAQLLSDAFSGVYNPDALSASGFSFQKVLTSISDAFHNFVR